MAPKTNKPKPLNTGKPKAPKLASAGGYTQPPVMAYDPSIEAERRSQQRGLQDILKDTSRARHFAEADYNTKLGDINLSNFRGLQDIGSKEGDIRLREQRGTEDFHNQLTDLIHSFQVRGREQTQTAAAAGVLDNSTAAAAAARRQENFELARRPIDTGQRRLTEDTQRALGEVGVARTRLGEDTGREQRLSRQDLDRTILDLVTKRRRAKREQRISNIDLIEQEVFSARQNKPGAFSNTGAPKNKKQKRR